MVLGKLILTSIILYWAKWVWVLVLCRKVQLLLNLIRNVMWLVANDVDLRGVKLCLCFHSSFYNTFYGIHTYFKAFIYLCSGIWQRVVASGRDLLIWTKIEVTIAIEIVDAGDVRIAMILWLIWEGRSNKWVLRVLYRDVHGCV